MPPLCLDPLGESFRQRTDVSRPLLGQITLVVLCVAHKEQVPRRVFRNGQRTSRVVQQRRPCGNGAHTERRSSAWSTVANRPFSPCAQPTRNALYSAEAVVGSGRTAVVRRLRLGMLWLGLDGLLSGVTKVSARHRVDSRLVWPTPSLDHVALSPGVLATGPLQA